MVLFSSDREAVNRALIRVSAGRMVDGMQVRVRGTVGHQATRGVVQLRMRWIDTDYTLGRLAADRRAVLEGLATEGLLDRQAGLALPVAPRRIGLVTSPGSAAHGDFLHELTQSGFGFTVLFTPATVQGVGAAGSIASALSALEAHRPDVVAVVRGGGSQTDLAVFDSDVVARAVATASFPVLTGIGHEVDQTVADRVAARAVKTPTACAQLVVGMVRDFATRLSTAERNLRHGTERVTVQARRRLDHITPRLGSVTSRRLTSGGGALDRTAQRLRWSAAAALEYRQRRLDDTASAVTGAAGAALGGAKAASSAAARRLATSATHGVSGSRRRLDALAALVKAHDPDLMLARGWTVTRTAGGLLVRSPEEVSVGDERGHHHRRRGLPQRGRRAEDGREERSMSDDDSDIGYGEAMQELEALLDEIEAEDVDIDLLATRVKRAAELVRICRRRIHDTQVQVEQIVSGLDAVPPTEPGASTADPG